MTNLATTGSPQWGRTCPGTGSCTSHGSGCRPMPQCLLPDPSPDGRFHKIPHPEVPQGLTLDLDLLEVHDGVLRRGAVGPPGQVEQALLVQYIPVLELGDGGNGVGVLLAQGSPEVVVLWLVRHAAEVGLEEAVRALVSHGLGQALVPLLPGVEAVVVLLDLVVGRGTIEGGPALLTGGVPVRVQVVVEGDQLPHELRYASDVLPL